MGPAGASTSGAPGDPPKDAGSAWTCVNPERSPAMFSEMVHPRGILTIPSGLPVVVRQFVSLLLLIGYPFWFLLVLALWAGARVFYVAVRIIFFPVTLWFILSDRAGYKARKEERKAEKLDVFLQLVVRKPAPGATPPN